jgi:hypothetical protein
VARSSGSSGNTAEALDWLGQPVSCRDCPHEDIRSGAHCDLGRVCVQDRRARRIDRFFAANSGQAPNYLRHSYFEVRALAAKYAHVFVLPPLLSDPEPSGGAGGARRRQATALCVNGFVKDVLQQLPMEFDLPAHRAQRPAQEARRGGAVLG